MASNISSHEKLALLDRASAVQAIHDSYITAVADGAILAVNQVQDKRIEFLEKGPTLTVNELVFEVLLSVCLSSKVSGKAIASLTKSILGKVFKSRAAILVLGNKAVGKDLSGQELFRIFAKADPKTIKDLNDFKISEIQQAIVNKTPLEDVYTGVLATILSNGPATIGKLSEKATQAVRKKKSVTLLPYDTPGVSILDSAFEFRSKQLNQSRILFDSLRHRIIVDAMSREKLKILSDDLKSYDKATFATIEHLKERFTPSQTKQLYKSFFELIIWTFIFDMKEPKDYHMSISPHNSPPKFEVDDAFGYYVLSRLVNPKSPKLQKFFTGTKENYLNDRTQKGPSGGTLPRRGRALKELYAIWHNLRAGVETQKKGEDIVTVIEHATRKVRAGK